jgi:exonuclease 3'-5' domain-containing protein 1
MSRVLSTTTYPDSVLINNLHGTQGAGLDDGSSSTMVDSDSTLSEMIDTLASLPTKPPSIYIDLEGIKLSRQGTISILQIYVLPKTHTYLVDVHQLQDKAFSTSGKTSGHCLKSILETKDIPKVFFDVRNDSDALFYHFQINLSGVDDIQLMELATRTFSREFVCGLQKCIERDAIMTYVEKSKWNATKAKGVKLFAPEKGGRYEVFNERPLVEEIREYCVQDVQFLPRLWSHYNRKMTPGWQAKVQKATEERVLSSQKENYDGHSREKARCPAGWHSSIWGL